MYYTEYDLMRYRRLIKRQAEKEETKYERLQEILTYDGYNPARMSYIGSRKGLNPRNREYLLCKVIDEKAEILGLIGKGRVDISSEKVKANADRRNFMDRVNQEGAMLMAWINAKTSGVEREVFILRFVDGMEFRDIDGTLKISSHRLYTAELERLGIERDNVRVMRKNRLFDAVLSV